jgi:AhpC/TSA antioxidant enzyme
MHLRDLANIEVLTPRGRPVFFGDLWKDQPAVIAFVRHFGCLFCYEQVAEMVEVSADIERWGGRFCVIGNGTPLHAGVFMAEAKLKGDVFTDPGRLLYSGLAMRHGVFTTLNPTSSRHARRAYARGYRQRGLRGDPWQQGGAIVAARDGAVAFLQRFAVAGERVDLADLRRAVERCAR